MRRFVLKILAISTLAVIVLVPLFITVYRPWQLTWGATEEEIHRGMPGDGLVPEPTFNATRAVTIKGRPEEIWPWIVQIGYKKAGFYSHDWLDNEGIPSAERIVPEYQNLTVGDKIPLSESVDAEVRVLDRNRFLLLLVEEDSETHGAWTWAWGLYEQDAEHTRLVTRLRARLKSPVSNLILDAFEIVMMRKCLLGIKRRVEGRIIENRATGYSRRPTGGVERAAFRNPQECFGCGAIFSTVFDLFRLQRALVQGDLLPKAALREMWAPAIQSDWEADYGLGWFIGELLGRKVVEARGGTSGFMASLQYFPSEDLVVVALLNQDFMLHRELFDRLSAIALGEPWTPLFDSSSSRNPLIRFAGTYLMEDGARVELKQHDGALYMQEVGSPKRFEVLPIDDRTGFAVDPNARLIFTAGSANSPSLYVRIRSRLAQPALLTSILLRRILVRNAG